MEAEADRTQFKEERTMRIMNNVGSLNAWRNLSMTDHNLSKSLERLSSGYRINRSADDAAGLAISEKMRSQIKGMNQAARNAQDGVSLVQTAEGALNEVHTILQRMRELGVQAANGTLTGADRNTVQNEMDELSAEITRISNTTQFNSKDLINGAMQATAASGGGTGEIIFQIGPNQNQTMTFSVAAMDSYTLGIGRDFREMEDNSNIVNTIVSASMAGLGAVNSAEDYTLQLTWDATNSYYTGSLVDAAGTVVATAENINAGETVNLLDAATQTNTLLTLVMDNAILDAQTGLTASLQFHSANSTQFANGAKTEEAVSIAGLDLTTEANASAAITKIDTAVNTVSAQRAQLGAMQNRLEHTINNLRVVSENLVASESRIRDVDMAMEMSQFTKNQILMQAGTAMLAQANAKNQAVLQLLQ
jgi:flagellin